jgi:hypothetical protein
LKLIETGETDRADLERHHLKPALAARGDARFGRKWE